jgi:hypothetical protein
MQQKSFFMHFMISSNNKVYGFALRDQTKICYLKYMQRRKFLGDYNSAKGNICTYFHLCY